jgi:hypothetical protein
MRYLNASVDETSMRPKHASLGLQLSLRGPRLRVRRYDSLPDTCRQYGSNPNWNDVFELTK